MFEHFIIIIIIIIATGSVDHCCTNRESIISMNPCGGGLEYLDRSQRVVRGDEEGTQCPGVHVRWGPCPHSMARPRIADRGTASSYGG
jgi:hypothetical protein